MFLSTSKSSMAIARWRMLMRSLLMFEVRRVDEQRCLGYFCRRKVGLVYRLMLQEIFKLSYEEFGRC